MMGEVWVYCYVRNVHNIKVGDSNDIHLDCESGRCQVESSDFELLYTQVVST